MLEKNACPRDELDTLIREWQGDREERGRDASEITRIGSKLVTVPTKPELAGRILWKSVRDTTEFPLGLIWRFWQRSRQERPPKRFTLVECPQVRELDGRYQLLYDELDAHRLLTYLKYGEGGGTGKWSLNDFLDDRERRLAREFTEKHPKVKVEDVQAAVDEFGEHAKVWRGYRDEHGWSYSFSDTGADQLLIAGYRGEKFKFRLVDASIVKLPMKE